MWILLSTCCRTTSPCSSPQNLGLMPSRGCMQVHLKGKRRQHGPLWSGGCKGQMVVLSVSLWEGRGNCHKAWAGSTDTSGVQSHLGKQHRRSGGVQCRTIHRRTPKQAVIRLAASGTGWSPELAACMAVSEAPAMLRLRIGTGWRQVDGSRYNAAQVQCWKIAAWDCMCALQ